MEGFIQDFREGQMEWIRWQENPWGQEIILGLSWELVWIALALGGVFAVGHALVARARPAKSSAEASRRARSPEAVKSCSR